MTSDRLKRNVLLLIPLLLLVAACATTMTAARHGHQPGPAAQHPVEGLRHDGQGKTMRAIIATLQDLGFMLDRADYTLASSRPARRGPTRWQMQVAASLRVTVTVRPRARSSSWCGAMRNICGARHGRKTLSEFFNSLEKAMFLEATRLTDLSFPSSLTERSG